MAKNRDMAARNRGPGCKLFPYTCLQICGREYPIRGAKNSFEKAIINTL